jgi:hypothetical protein
MKVTSPADTIKTITDKKKNEVQQQELLTIFVS